MDYIYTFSCDLFMMARTALGLMGGKSCSLVGGSLWCLDVLREGVILGV